MEDFGYRRSSIARISEEKKMVTTANSPKQADIVLSFDTSTHFWQLYGPSIHIVVSGCPRLLPPGPGL
jgi:hypothetical protein